MNKNMALIGILVLVLFGAIYILSPTQVGLFALNQQEIKIGVITTLTGEMSKYGEGIANAQELAASEINSAGGINGKQIKLIFEDSPCDPQKAINAVNKLVQIDKVDFIVGPLCSSELLAIAPILNKANIPIISSTATSPNITSAGEYVFRNIPSDDLRAKVFAEYIYKDSDIKEISIIYANDDASVTYEKYFTEKFEFFGGKILSKEIYAKGAKDMRTQLTKIKNANPKAILMISWPEETGSILKSSKEMNINVKFFEGFEVMSDPHVKQIAGDLVNGVIYIQPAESKSLKAEQFKKQYEEKYGATPPFYSAESYDLIYLYKLAIQNAKGDLDKVKNELYKIKNYEGASGTITFDQQGDVTKPFEIGEVTSSGLRIIKIVD